MYKIFFEKNGLKREIGKSNTKEEVRKVINDFLKEREYKSYYWNIIKIDSKTERIDVGDWSEFFYVIEN